MRCFVYCEWIDDARMTRSLPSARFVGRVRLPDHRLAFVSFKEQGSDTVHGSGCHIEPEKGSSLPGLLWELDVAAAKEAERLSRVPEGRYVKRLFAVEDEQGNKVQSAAYVIREPVGRSAPSREYRDHMIAGARKHGFPADYIRHIETL
jgi:gamma-glutamylcyclotransferase